MITQYKSSEHKNTCSLVLYGVQSTKGSLLGSIYMDPEHTIKYAPHDDVGDRYEPSKIWPHDITVKYTPYGSDSEVSVHVIECYIALNGTFGTLYTPAIHSSGVIAKLAWALPTIQN